MYFSKVGWAWVCFWASTTGLNRQWPLTRPRFSVGAPGVWPELLAIISGEDQGHQNGNRF